MTPKTLRQALTDVFPDRRKPVREHEVLRIAAELIGREGSGTLEEARRQVLLWVQNRCGGSLPPEAGKFQDFEHLLSGWNSRAVRIENDQYDIWAIRADDQDKNVKGRTWTTEVVVWTVRDGAPQFSARLLAGTPEDQLVIEPHTPGFMRQLVDKCGLRSGRYDLSAEPWRVASVEEVDPLFDMLVDPDRRLPVFVLTTLEDSDDPDVPLLDPGPIARAVLGIAHVVVLPAAWTWALTHALGRQRAVFGGAIRSYLPGFEENANPYRHRLIVADRIRESGGVEKFTRRLKIVAADESRRRNRLGEEILAFASIRRFGLQSRQKDLEAAGASTTEQLNTAKERIKALESQAEQDKESLAFFDAEHRIAEERADVFEDELRGARYRIEQLVDQLNRSGQAPDTDIPLPSSWDEFVGWCETHLSGRLTLSRSACRGVRSPEFRDVAVAGRCLRWLANECRDRRINGGGTVRDESVEDGIWNTPCGGDEYEVDWQNSRRRVDWHIKSGGNTRDPTRCLRIYYFWDPSSKQFVVADMPAHQKTSAT